MKIKTGFLIALVYAQGLYGSNPYFGFGSSPLTGPNTNTLSNSNTSLASVVTAAPVTPILSYPQMSDWTNVLMPVFEVYANSGLSAWWMHNKIAFYDYEYANLSSYVAQQAVKGRSDTIPAWKSQNNSQVLPKYLLQNQSQLVDAGSGWASSGVTDFHIQNFIQSGFGNTVAQYYAVLVENIAARLTVAASPFLASSSTPSTPIKNGGFLSQLDPENPQASDQIIIGNVINQAQNLFAQARYARSMYQFPQSLPGAINSLSPVTQTVQDQNTGAPSFVMPNNLTDIKVMSPNASMGVFSSSTTPAASLASSPFLNPMTTFCGVIYINGPGGGVTQTNPNSSGSASPIARSITPSMQRITSNLNYAPVYFLPALPVNATYSNSAAPFYSSYNPVDQAANFYTGSAENDLVNRTVSCTSASINQQGATEGNIIVSVTVSSYPVNTNDPIGIYWSAIQGDVSEESGINFNATDLANFFACPHQWAVVMKIDQVTWKPSVLGLVKLNPYDFPLNYTIANMNTVLGIPSGASFEATSPEQTAGGQSVGTSTVAPTTFSQQAVWDGIIDLYTLLCPFVSNPNFNMSNYSFAYIVLQGLLNGYLMSNTYSVLFNLDGWPNCTTVDTEYATYYGSPLVPGSLYPDQVFPTPLASDWLGSNSPLDLLYLRALIGMRSVLQSLYCPYDGLVLPPSTVFILTTGKNKEGQIVLGWFPLPESQYNGMDCVLEYMMSPEGMGRNVLVYYASQEGRYVDSHIRVIAGQNYTASTTTTPSPSLPSNSYQWMIVPSGPATSEPAPGTTNA